MTFNEFKFCCIVFFEKYKNLTMNDIIKDTNIKNVDSVIKDLSFDTRSCYGSVKMDSMFFHSECCIRLNGYGDERYFYKNYKWYNSKEFLKTFKIPLEDIV